MGPAGASGGLVKMSVLVAEDFVPFRQLVCLMLRSNAEVRDICEVGTGIQAVEKAAEMRPDLVFLDIGLPGLDGLAAARRIRSVSPRSKIIFLTQEHSVEMVKEALNAGACGYVVKTDAGKELMIAVDAVLRGERFVGQRFSESNLLAAEQPEGVS